MSYDYDSLSDFYDRFNEEPDYERYWKRAVEKFGLPQTGLALDCGCGTGTLLLHLCNKGYDCTGTDVSPAMLQKAEEKLLGAGYLPHLVCQDLTELDLFGGYDAVFCTLDTVNHLQKRDLARFFRKLYNFVEPGGVFVFDAKTKEGFRRTEGTRVCDDGKDFLCMQGDFTGKYAFYRFTMFHDGKRADEDVEERFYEPEEFRKLLEQAGFRWLGKVAYGKDRNLYGAKRERV